MHIFYLIALLGLFLSAPTYPVSFVEGPGSLAQVVPQCKKACSERYFLRGDTFFIAFQVIRETETAGRQTVIFGDAAKKIFLRKESPLEADVVEKPTLSVKKEVILYNRGGDRLTMDQTSGEIDLGEKGKVKWDFKVHGAWYFQAEIGTEVSDSSTFRWDPIRSTALLAGFLEVNGEKREVAALKGYLDHNWTDTELPKWWFWMQASEFTDCPETAITVGGAGFPPQKYREVGASLPRAAVSVGVKFQGARGRSDVSAFNSFQSDDPLSVTVSFPHFKITGRNTQGHSIEIEAEADRASFRPLPIEGKKNTSLNNLLTLAGKMRFTLYEGSGKSKKTILSCESGNNAGLEYGNSQRDLSSKLSFALNGKIF